MARVLEHLAPRAAQMTLTWFARVELFGQNCYVSRSGYTGEDGYEISVFAVHAEVLTRCLLAEPEVAPIGLGARDSLRLEAGLCLYGHGMDSATTPVEASLGQAISKARRADGVRAGGFPDAERVFAQQVQGAASKRIGFPPQGRMPARESAEIVNAQGRAIGKVSSGGFGPNLNALLVMGYALNELAGLGSEVTVMVRGKPVALVISKMSFIVQRYYRG